MSEPKTVIENVKEYIPDTNTVKETFQNASNTVSTGFENVKNSVQDTLGEFSEKGPMNASNDFLESNGLFAKFAFIILVLIVFLFLFKLGLQLISYFSQTSSSPYVVQGLLDGNTQVVIPQNPSATDAVPILRSVNETTGTEFTWSIWLMLQYNKVNEKVDCIFVKGTNAFDISGGHNTNNGPGLYVDKETEIPGTDAVMGQVGLLFMMDMIKGDKVGIIIRGLPLTKWVHVAFRLENMVIDAYVNGVIKEREQLTSAPKQNYYDIVVAPNGGFQGELSNLQYFNRALNVFEINNIVMFGPNLTNSKYSNTTKNATGNYSYISNNWYNYFK